MNDRKWTSPSHSADEAAQRFVDAGGARGGANRLISRLAAARVVRDPWGNHLVLLDTSKGLLVTDHEGNVTDNLR